MPKQPKKKPRAKAKPGKGGNRPVHGKNRTAEISVRVPLTPEELAAFDSRRAETGIQTNRIMRFMILGWTQGDFEVRI